MINNSISPEYYARGSLDCYSTTLNVDCNALVCVRKIIDAYRQCIHDNDPHTSAIQDGVDQDQNNKNAAIEADQQKDDTDLKRCPAFDNFL